jgi:hypothetical protein
MKQSHVVLERGVKYRLKASGVAMNGGSYRHIDAEWQFNDEQPPQFLDACADTGTDMGIEINDGRNGWRKPFWGPFNTNHVYEIDWVGEGFKILLRYQDCNPDDNQRPLQVQIFRC